MSLSVTAKFANVFRPEVKGKVVKASVSTTRKDQNQGKRYSNWYGTFLGSCVENAKTLQDGDTIEITKAYISHEAGISADGSAMVDAKGNKVYYTNLNILEYNFVSHKRDNNSSSSSAPSVEEDDSDNLPF